MLKPAINPLFPAKATLNINDLTAPVVFRKREPSSKKIIRRLTRCESASEALAGLVTGQDIFGFSKGQFSLLDIIAEINGQLGPFNLICSTWTAANVDLDHVATFLSNHKLLSAKFILDLTFQRRQPAIARKMREVFGRKNFRVTQNHSKFGLLWNEKHRLVLKTSMNLNTNPRFENFEISWDQDLFNFLMTICDELFAQDDQAEMGTNQMQKQFNETA